MCEKSARTRLALLPSLVALVLVAGCSGAASPVPTRQPTGSIASPLTPVPATPAPSAAGTAPTAAAVSPSEMVLSGLDRVRTAGTLTWCSSTDYPPMESTGAGGSPEGLDIDIAAEVAKRLGVTSTVVPTGWDDLLSDVTTGKCDLVISSMSSTFGARKAQADFVDYLTVWTALLVPSGNPKEIHTLDDLAGKAIAVEPNVAPEAALRAASSTLVAAGKPAIDIRSVSWSDDESVKRLVAGDVDALAGDSLVVPYHVAQPPYAGKAEAGGPRIDPQPVGIAVAKGETGLTEAVAAAIASMTDDGTMAALAAKWGLTDAVALLE